MPVSITLQKMWVLQTKMQIQFRLEQGRTVELYAGQHTLLWHGDLVGAQRPLGTLHLHRQWQSGEVGRQRCEQRQPRYFQRAQSVIKWKSEKVIKVNFQRNSHRSLFSLTNMSKWIKEWSRVGWLCKCMRQ